MKHEDFVHHELHSAQKWVRVVREGSEVHALKDSEDKEDRGEVAVESDSRDTPIHATTVEDINDILAYGYKFDDDRLPAPENTQNNTGKTEQPFDIAVCTSLVNSVRNASTTYSRTIKWKPGN